MSTDDLTFLQSLTESELTELVIIPLLDEMGYSDIRYTHGPLEQGKDLVFRGTTPLEGPRHYSAVIKATALSGSVSSSRSIRELLYQIEQSLAHPFSHPSGELSIAHSYVFVSHELKASTLASIASELETRWSHVTFIDGPSLLALLSDHLPTLIHSLPDPEARYLHTLSRSLSAGTSLGDVHGGRRIQLSEIYTGLKLSSILQEDAALLSFADPTGEEPGEEILDLLSSGGRLAVLADVGSGKTTLLQKLAIDLADVSGLSGDHPRRIPILVRLNRFTSRQLDNFDSFLAALEDEIRRGGLDSFSLVDAQDYVLLLDGFDELAVNQDARCEEYLETLGASSLAALVVTARPSRFPSLDGFQYVRVLPFSRGDITTFFGKWFRDDSDLATALDERIGGNSDLLAFCRTPLILTLYAALAARTGSGGVGELPVRRTDIYEEVVEMLAGKWDALRGVQSQFDSAVKLNMLEKLAYDLHRDKRKQATYGRIVKAAHFALGAAGMGDEFTRALIDEIFFRSALLRRTDHDSYEFAHLSFQEYLCARRLVRNQQTALVRHNLLDEWWQTCLIFYFGITRDLDSIRVPSGRKIRGNAIRILRYLAEADWTDAETRALVHRDAAADLLERSRIGKGEIELLRSVGDGLVSALQTGVEERKSSQGYDVDAGNYIGMLIELDTAASRAALYTSSSVIEEIDVLRALELIALVAPRGAGGVWVQEWIQKLRGAVSGYISEAVFSDSTSHDHRVRSYAEGLRLSGDARGSAITRYRASLMREAAASAQQELQRRIDDAAQALLESRGSTRGSHSKGDTGALLTELRELKRSVGDSRKLEEAAVDGEV